jgi:excisionase family DNA binding protein
MDVFITLREAADLVGVSRPTLFRAVQRGELQIRTENSGKTKRIMVLTESVQDWACSREKGEQATEQPGEQTAQANEQPEQEREQVPLLAHLDLVRLLEDTQLRLLEATERAHRAERQSDIVKMELFSTRNCLTEQAQSLFEKSTDVKQREELLEQSRRQHEAWKQDLVKLESENAARLALYEQEKQQWMSELETTKSRVNWLEKRVPRWVRGLFGAV